eukprot:349641-Chlamydomonas_euryale.AAC.12
MIARKHGCAQPLAHRGTREYFGVVSVLTWVRKPIRTGTAHEAVNAHPRLNLLIPKVAYNICGPKDDPNLSSRPLATEREERGFITATRSHQVGQTPSFEGQRCLPLLAGGISQHPGQI